MADEMNVGLRAIFSPEFDKRETKSEIDVLEDRLGDIDAIEPKVDTDSVSQQIAGVDTSGLFSDIDGIGDLGKAISGGIGGGGGGKIGAGAGGMASKLGGAAGGGLVGVALGGALSVAMLKGIQKMASFAPRGRKMLDMFGEAMSLFFRPFGDLIGKAFMPYAEGALKAMAKFNEVYHEKGLAVAVVSMAGDIMDALATPEGLGAIVGALGGAAAGAKGGAMAGAAVGSVIPGVGTAAGAAAGGVAGGIFGGAMGLGGGALLADALSGFDWKKYVNPLNWADWVMQLSWDRHVVDLFWNTFVVDLLWDTFVVDLLWDTFMVDLVWDWFVKGLVWGSFIKILMWGKYVSQLDWKEYLNPLNWPGYVKGLVWDTFIVDLLWKGFVRNLIWRAFIKNIVWEAFINNILWDAFIKNMVWGAFVSKLPWGTFVDSLRWTRYINPLRWADFIGDLGGKIPGLQHGGVVRKPTQAVIGEAGPEAVLPLDDLGRMLSGERRAGAMQALSGSERGGRGVRTGTRGGDMASVEQLLERLLRAVQNLEGETSVEVDGQTLVKQERKHGKRYSDSRKVYK